MNKDDTPEVEPEDETQPHAFWSGIIAFGLVSLPVSLFPAHTGKISLKMVDDKGTLLKRQYFCDEENRPLERDEIVRGYELEKYQYVVVEDDELEALEPQKSREIDLKRFVPLSSINPIYFERAYFLVPDSDTTKAYRLLAKSMEDEHKAGIATFVMRGREYLVAILSEGGILRAETLRFHDELRTPEYIGLPERQPADQKMVKRMVAAIQKSTSKQLDMEQMGDQQTHKLMQYIEQKLNTGSDVVPAATEPEPVASESNVIDLMQVLKERLQGRSMQPSSSPKKQESGRKQHKQQRTAKEVNKHDLYEQAQELDIPGRSRMTKQQLIAAINRKTNKHHTRHT